MVIRNFAGRKIDGQTNKICPHSGDDCELNTWAMSVRHTGRGMPVQKHFLNTISISVLLASSTNSPPSRLMIHPIVLCLGKLS